MIVPVIAQDTAVYLWPATQSAGNFPRERPPYSAATFVPAAYAPAAPPAPKIFQIANRGSARCNKQPCSPDGKWQAADATASLSAGPGNVFLKGYAVCIAGPCPWTEIVNDGFSKGGPTIAVTVRNWSDTATYKLWGDVKRQ